MFRIATEWVLGVRPTWDGLWIQPCLPPHWKGFAMKRAFRGATYAIEVKVGRGPASITVDGQPCPSPLVPAFGDGREHRVVVTLPPS